MAYKHTHQFLLPQAIAQQRSGPDLAKVLLTKALVKRRSVWIALLLPCETYKLSSSVNKDLYLSRRSGLNACNSA